MAINNDKNKESENKKVSRKGGGPKLTIKTPYKMRQYFDAYVVFNKTQFQDKKVYNAKLDKTAVVKLKRPLTQEGFSVFLRRQNISCNVNNYFINRDGRYPEFVSVMREISEEIFDESYSGAANGIYNPGIVARKLKLAEVTKNEGEGPMIKIVDMRQAKKINDSHEGNDE